MTFWQHWASVFGQHCLHNNIQGLLSVPDMLALIMIQYFNSFWADPRWSVKGNSSKVHATLWHRGAGAQLLVFNGWWTVVCFLLPFPMMMCICVCVCVFLHVIVAAAVAWTAAGGGNAWGGYSFSTTSWGKGEVKEGAGEGSCCQVTAEREGNVCWFVCF